MTPEEQAKTLAHTTTFKRKRLKRRGLARARILRSWPYVVWLIAAVVVAYQYSKGSQFGGVSGAVQGLEELVAPLQTARLMSIEVIVGQRVSAGDVLAQLDPTLIDLDIAAVKAEQFEAAGSIAGYQQNILDIVQRFDSSKRDAESELERVRIEMRSRSAELEELQKEQQRRESLLESGLVSMQDASELRPVIASLKQQVAAYPDLVKIQSNRVVTAASDRKELEDWLRLEKDEPLSSVINRKMEARSGIIEARLKALEIQRDNHTLRASHDGVVAEIFREQGDVLGAGQQFARITAEHSNVVVGFLPETFLNAMQVGQEVAVWRVHSPGKYRATVVSIAPDVRALPTRIMPLSGQALRGRRVILNVQDAETLISGESVRISPLGHPWTWSEIKRALHLSPAASPQE